MSDVAIRAMGVGKRYRVGTKAPYKTLRDSLSSAASRLFRREKGQESQDEFWALNDVSFEVKHGEAFGLIGRNGAGKSTLLKVLSRITEPTKGEIVLNGRVGSLLEVGTGFHPELTGRENIFLNGAILGMQRRDIQRNFDQIVEFAEVERFLDTPVRHYSSGMYMRLAFAVAAHLQPEILLIDEVLAVGDAAFQKKCLGKMGDVAAEGRTVVFVSHNMGAIRALCRRAIVLSAGAVSFDGSPDEAVTRYLNAGGAPNATDGFVEWSDDAPESEDVRLRSIAVRDVTGHPRSVHEADKDVRVEISYEVKQRLQGARMNLLVLTQEGELAFIATDHDMRGDAQQPGGYVETCTLPGGLLNRRPYVLAMSIDIPGIRVAFPRTELLSVTIAGAPNHGSVYPEHWPGVVAPRLRWTIEST